MYKREIKLQNNRPPTLVLLGQADKLLEFKEKLEHERIMALAEEEEKKRQDALEEEWKEMLRQKRILAGISCQLPELIDEKCKGRLVVFSEYDWEAR